MAKARLYLFHGNDSRASSTDLHRWVEVFLSKYGETTQYLLHADEMPYEELVQRLQQALETQSLFPEPRLVVVKRLSNGLTPARVKDILKVIGGQLAKVDEQVTVVFWEDKLLAATHALLVWFADHADKKQAEIKKYQVGSSRSLIDNVLKRRGLRLDKEADLWLEGHARRLEREQRIAAKLRTGDEIANDWRVWILENLVEAAVLLSGEKTPGLEHFEQAAGVVQESVSPFEIINAIQAGDWKKARKLARQWDSGDEGAYFGLVALLRNNFRRPGGPAQESFRTYALELLAEIEVISKNVTMRQAWLLELFITRCEQFRGVHVPLLAPRRLWLSHVQRVE